MSKSILRLQDPTDPDSAYLLETLLERAVAARYGGAAFAWATEAGVRLLIRDTVFERFLKKYPFDLIVGVDTTTTPEALVALKDAERDLKGLRVLVFISPSNASLFHPKMSWFGEPDGGSLVVGSGNLTGAGLRQNWEAYALCPLSVSETAELKGQWEAWTKTHQSRLHALLNPLLNPLLKARGVVQMHGARSAGMASPCQAEGNAAAARLAPFSGQRSRVNTDRS